MATIPRYQSMGVQYADLPRLSTAGMEQTAKLYDVLSEKLDRMSAYYQERAVTEAQKAGAKYAVQNPLTKEQLDTALGTPEGVKVAGAGRIFQQSYEKFQAHQLSTELQMEGQRKIASVSAAIESGSPVDLNSINAEIKDMIDGYTASVMALDPERALQMKASLSTVGNTLYQKAAAQAIKQHKEQVQTNVNLAIDSMPRIVENIIEAAGSIDPSTGKEINIDQMLEIAGKPFLDVVPLLGNKPYQDFLSLVKDAKINALVKKGADREFNKSPSDAITALNQGNFGKLTGVYGSLTQKQKEEIRDRVLKSYSEEYTANEQAKKAEKEEKERQWVTLQLEFYNPNTSVDRKREITNEGIALGKLDPTQAASWMKPPSDRAEKHPELVMTLRDEISRGFMQRTDQLLMFKDRLNDDEFNTLATSMLSTQGKMALDSIKLAVGVPDNPFIPVSAEKNARYIKVFNQYQRELGNRIIDKSTGVLRDQSHTEAANAAIEWFNSDKGTASQTKGLENSKTKMKDILDKNGLSYAGDWADVDPSKIKGLKGTALIDFESAFKSYKDILNEMGKR